MQITDDCGGIVGVTTKHYNTLKEDYGKLREALEDVAENLEFWLAKSGVCMHGDSKDRCGDVDSCGGTEALERAKQILKETKESE